MSRQSHDESRLRGHFSDRRSDRSERRDAAKRYLETKNARHHRREVGQERLRRRGRHLRRRFRPQDTAVLPHRRAPRADQGHGTQGRQTAHRRRQAQRLRP